MATVALYSPSVLSSAASGYRLPTLPVTLAFVRACAGDVEEWERRWWSVAEQPGATSGAVLTRRRPAAGSQPPAEMSTAWPLCPCPAQLPLGPHEFVGRAAELARARELLNGPPEPLVVSGDIGAGKSAFAMHLASEIAGRFPDGQLYGDLGSGGSPLDVMAGFLRSLGVPADHIPADPTQRAGLYRSLLVRCRLLVVLDDAFDEAQVRPLCAPAPHSRVVVTSRSGLLGLDAHRIELGPLPRADSMAMLTTFAGERLRAEPQAGERLARLCHDLPLALNIAGRKLAANREWPIEYTVTQLSAGLMDRMRIGDVSLRGRLRSAYQRLGVTARRTLRHAALCPGPRGQSLVAAAPLAAALGVPLVVAEEQLETLVRCGLLRKVTAAGRYAVPPLVRLFVDDEPDDN
jgi:NB-ARC domain